MNIPGSMYKTGTMSCVGHTNNYFFFFFGRVLGMEWLGLLICTFMIRWMFSNGTHQLAPPVYICSVYEKVSPCFCQHLVSILFFFFFYFLSDNSFPRLMQLCMIIACGLLIFCQLSISFINFYNFYNLLCQLSFFSALLEFCVFWILIFYQLSVL